MFDLNGITTELMMLLFEQGVTKKDLVSHMAPYAGSDLPDNVLDYLATFEHAAYELAEERAETQNAQEGSRKAERKP